MFELRKEEERPGLDFDAIRIRLASPETIRKWSRGEVTKPETINYRTFKPEKDGLFCERIFGPVRDWECNCGKYKKIRYRGVVCDRCGVEVTKSIVRRERMGHIELAVPVSHIWYFKVMPSRIGHLLEMSTRDLERVLYYESYVVTDPGDTPLKKKQILNDEEYALARERYGTSFTAEMGAAPIRDLLRRIDVEELAAELRARVKVETSLEAKKESLKRLRIVQAFCVSGNRPESMVLDVIPVIPPDLRPLVPLEGGRFATSDLNDLYRRVITRNDRLKKLMELRAPEIILRNEKRMLQEAVDALFDNSRRSRAIKGRGKRPLKSLSDILRGKQGRFRQNLLGKRVDYSGRSVIVVGPELKPYQCGLPKTMALELFKPFIIKRLEEKGYVQTVRSAKRLVEREKPGVWEILEEIVRSRLVLLNRAPTLHRLGIQAFEPVLIEGKAIKIHPLVCEAFNADFDGDQMAVHVPLSNEAQQEARNLMLSTNNILSPANGSPVAKPRQDVVLGCHYLTKEGSGRKGEGKFFAYPQEAILAYDLGEVDLHARIKVRVNGTLIETTTGRVIFNQHVPQELGFRNELMEKNYLERMVGEVYRRLGSERCIRFIDDLKRLGFEYATKGGLTIGIDDLIIPPEKEDLIRKGYQAAERIQSQYRKGKITDGERYNKVVDTWTHVTNQVADALIQRLRQDKGGFNPIYMMMESGARGSRDQVYQLAGMRGLMAKPQKRITGQIGEIIETPITSNFQQGLSVVEYFISTHGARKGLADTALKTAEAGYLTRRLVDVAQDVIITEEDCGTILGQDIGPLKEGEEVIESLKDRILGRVALEDARNPLTGEVLVHAGDEIEEEAASELEESGVEKVKIRSVLTCEAKRGLCRKCYGRNLATGRMVSLGEAVGVIAAQSIGEPGTQLTLRTFHIGGTAARIAAQSRAVVKGPGRVTFQNLRVMKRSDEESVAISREGEGAMMLDAGDAKMAVRYSVPYGAIIRVKDASEVKKGDVLFEWDPYSIPILTDKKGKIEFEDLVEGITVREELDESTGLPQRVVVEDREKQHYPCVNILDEKGKKVATHSVPTGAHLLVHDNAVVSEGDLLAKLPREISKTRDITGGLPRVTELVESRKPKDQAIVTEIDGLVHLGKIGRGMRLVVVENENGEKREYQIPHGKHLRVRDGDKVKAGDRLSEGPINPHDILRIKGATAVQEYLVNEIQEVYRLQGVRINDKHIEVIVRQMLQKVRIEDPGDAKFIEGEQVDKVELREENERVMRDAGQPATFQPLLLGITKASLSTTSFISAASFQETTRVLTDAAIQGKRDQLLGLKENVIVGRLIPAGTGFDQHRRTRTAEGRKGSDAEKKELTEK